MILFYSANCSHSKMLLENVFVYWNQESVNEEDIVFNKRYEKELRKYIIKDVYEMLCKKQKEYARNWYI